VRNHPLNASPQGYCGTRLDPALLEGDPSDRSLTRRTRLEDGWVARSSWRESNSCRQIFGFGQRPVAKCWVGYRPVATAERRFSSVAIRMQSAQVQTSTSVTGWSWVRCAGRWPERRFAPGRFRARIVSATRDRGAVLWQWIRSFFYEVFYARRLGGWAFRTREC